MLAVQRAEDPAQPQSSWQSTWDQELDCRRVKSITFNFQGRVVDTPDFPAGERAEAWIEFVNGAKRMLAFSVSHRGAFWILDLTVINSLKTNSPIPDWAAEKVAES